MNNQMKRNNQTLLLPQFKEPQMKNWNYKKIAEAIPTPMNLQPGNIFSNIFTNMVTTTQTQTTTLPSSSTAGKMTAGPPGGGGGSRQPNPYTPLLGPLEEEIQVAEGEILEVEVVTGRGPQRRRRRRGQRESCIPS